MSSSNHKAIGTCVLVSMDEIEAERKGVVLDVLQELALDGEIVLVDATYYLVRSHNIDIPYIGAWMAWVTSDNVRIDPSTLSLCSIN